MEKRKYKITVEETLAREVIVEATTAAEAVKKVKQMYRDEEIVLTGDDCIDTEFLVEVKHVPLNFN
jgi:hypothetical protein